MRNQFKKIFISIIFTLAVFSVFSFNVKGTAVTSDYASYDETETLISQTLESGINHKKVTAVTSTTRCTNTSDITNSPQQVNILEVPVSKDIRVVNYTYPTSSGWSKHTLTQFVDSFEKNNPGWTVIAGVNGDFFDINGTDKALPYHTNGTTLSDGELLRSIERKSVGYTNDGSQNSFIISSKVTFSNSHYLDIFDENGNVLGSFEISKVNEAPSNNEVGLYYTYRENVDSNNDGSNDTYNQIDITVPGENSFIVERPSRCLPTKTQNFYGKGTISKTNVETKLIFGQFAIVTDNTEVTTLLETAAYVRVQKKVTGDLTNCDQILGVGSTLMENGAISTDNSDGMREQRHPRTGIGVKEDGTLMFFVIDGRQTENDMYGMTQDEMGVMMKYYNCYSGVNIDGGGSSTFGVRDENGEFVIMNSPSDGNQRNNSNALLIVIPTVELKFSGLIDTGFMLDYDVSSKMEVSNLKVKVGDKEYVMNGNNMEISGLTADTNYEFSYTYDITYEGITRSRSGISQNIKTGLVGPKVDKAQFDINGDYVTLSYNIVDDNNLIVLGTITYDGGFLFVDYLNATETVLLSRIKQFNMKLDIDYNVSSVPNRTGKIVELFEWYPNTLDLNSYHEAEQQAILSYIEEVNESIPTLSKEEVLNKIKEAKNNISNVKTIAQKELDQYRNSKIALLQEYASAKSYYDTELAIINSYLTSAINNINIETNKSNIDNVVNNTKLLIDTVKTKDVVDVENYQEELANLKIDSISQLETYVANNNYNEQNSEKVNEIIKNATLAINDATTKEAVEDAYQNAITKIDEVKTSSCKSTSIIYFSLISSLFVSIFVLFKKKN